MSIKIHKLISTWQAGAVRVVRSIKKEGYSQGLLNQYRYSKWLTSVGDGAVFRTGDDVTYFGAVFALQHDLQLPVHIGGRTALELLGMGHYVRSGKRVIHLFGRPSRLPKWFIDYDWGATLKYHSSNLFKSSYIQGLTEYKTGALSVQISGEAQAMAEFLQLVKHEHSLEEAKNLMMGLSTLHPVKVADLLKSCNSFKVKRLFLLLAEECGHEWIKKIDIDSLDLGTGPRNLIRGGILHPKYKITVSRSILAERGR